MRKLYKKLLGHLKVPWTLTVLLCIYEYLVVYIIYMTMRTHSARTCKLRMRRPAHAYASTTRARLACTRCSDMATTSWLPGACRLPLPLSLLLLMLLLPAVAMARRAATAGATVKDDAILHSGGGAAIVQQEPASSSILRSDGAGGGEQIFLEAENFTLGG